MITMAVVETPMDMEVVEMAVLEAGAVVAVLWEVMAAALVVVMGTRVMEVEEVSEQMVALGEEGEGQTAGEVTVPQGQVALQQEVAMDVIMRAIVAEEELFVLEMRNLSLALENDVAAIMTD